MYKNVASQKIAVYAWDGANGTAKTGDAANITAQISKDGAASAATDDTNPTELDATDHPGVYIFDLTQAETNADLVVITPVSSTTDINFRPSIVYTDPVTPTKAGYINHSISTIDTVVDAIKAVTDVIPDAGALTTINTNTARLTAVRAAVLTDWINGGRLDLLLDAIKAKTDNLPSGVKKNVALASFEFLMIGSSDHVTPKTGLTVTAQISKDGGAFANSTNSVSEVANGIYKISLTQAEMNADVITLKFTATGADQRTITILTSS